MARRDYIDALGGKLPALERNVLKLRAFEVLLVLFYAEELKRWLTDHVKSNNKLKSKLSPRKLDGNWRSALDTLHLDGAFSDEQKAEIIQLIEYRNTIGHEIHHLFTDISSDRLVRSLVSYSRDQQQYSYQAVARFKSLHRHIDDLHKTHSYIFVVNFNGILFETAERIFQTEIAFLKKKIGRLSALRNSKIKKINAEISAARNRFRAEMDPDHPLNQYDDCRLTRRGQEICYRLFDDGKSDFAVAHLMGISLRAARQRKKMWTNLGGSTRIKHDPLAFPNRKFRRTGA